MTFIILLFFSVIADFPAIAIAEVILDGSMGQSGRLTGADYKIGAELGQLRGNNLFHSFSEFSLQSGESATFSGSNNIVSIISRVTGGNPSQINGMLRSTIPNANLYFLNPYGIIFGQSAQLDVPGSVHFSTANYLRFQDNQTFHTQLSENSTLTTATPQAFGFINNPAPISLIGSQLAVPNRQTLSLIGGKLNLSQTNLTAASGRLNLVSVAGRGEVTLLPENIAVSAPLGDMQIQQDSLLSTSTAKGTTDGAGHIYIRAGQFLLQRSSLETNTLSTSDGGGIDIQANTVAITEGSALTSDTYGSGKGGNVNIKATDTVTISGEKPVGTSIKVSGIRVRTGSVSKAENDNTGNAGDILIEVGTLLLKDGVVINNSTFSQGRGGNIKITVQGAITLSGVASDGYGNDIGADSWGNQANAGAGGTITIKAQQLQLSDGAQIGATSNGTGQGGNITLEIAKDVVLSGENANSGNKNKSTAILVGALSKNADAGNAGQLFLTTGNLIINAGAQLSASTKGAGQGGNISIIANNITLTGENRAHDAVSRMTATSDSKATFAGAAGELQLVANGLIIIDGGMISTDSYSAQSGGGIGIQANDLTIKNGGALASNTFGAGDGGSVVINAKGTVEIVGEKNLRPSGIRVRSGASTDKTPNTGNAGNIIIDANQLILRNGTVISGTTYGAGHGSDIQISARDAVILTGQSSDGYGSDIGADTYGKQAGAGTGGTITLKASRLELTDGGQIGATSNGAGQGGSITLDVSGNTILSGKSRQNNSSSIQVGSTRKVDPAGNAGSLTLQTGILILGDGGKITTETQRADGGNIQIKATRYLYLRNGVISTSVKAEKGNGGNITLVPDFIVLDDSNIIAQAEEGNGGNIAITTQAGIVYKFSFDRTLTNDINASSKLGISGVVSINSPDTNVAAGLVILPAAFLDVESLLKEACSSKYIEKNSHFIVTSPDLMSTSDDLQPSPPLSISNPLKPQIETTPIQSRRFVVKVSCAS